LLLDFRRSKISLMMRESSIISTWLLRCSKNKIMTAAMFAILGTVVGVFGTILTNSVSANRDDRRAWQGSLRSVVADLTSEVTKLRGLSYRLRDCPDDEDLMMAAQETLSRAQSLLRQLGLISKSKATQEAGDWLIHSVYWLWRSAQGEPGDFDSAGDAIVRWMSKLYAEARKELGLSPADLYESPTEGLPIPTGRQEVVAGTVQPGSVDGVSPDALPR
jgi:hypothetical protein